MTDAELIAMAYSRDVAPMIDLFEAVVEQSDGAALQMARDWSSPGLVDIPILG